VDLAQALDHWAVVTADFAAGGQPANSSVPGSSAQPATSGTYSALGISRVDEHLSVVLQAQHATSGFRDAGDASGVPPPLERNIAQAGWTMGHGGSLQAAFVAQRNADDTRQETVGLTYIVNVGRGSMSLNASRTTGDAQDKSLYLFYTLPLDNRRSTSTSVRYDSQQTAPNAALVQSLQKNLPVGVGDGYLLSAGTDGSYHAEYLRQTDTLLLNAAAARYQDVSAQSLTLSGGATLMDGEVRATRTVTEANVLPPPDAPAVGRSSC